MTYTIFKDGNTIKAKNENTGIVEFVGIDISTVLMSINSVILDNGTIYIKEGIYNPGSQVNFTKSINLITNENVIFNWINPSQYLFEFNGAEILSTIITADVPKNSNTITVANLGAAVPGDLLLIYDNTIWNPVMYPVWKTGELHEILSISGNTITISDRTINSFTIPNSGSVKLIRPTTVEINNIQINGANSTLDYRGIYLNYNKNSIIRNGKFQNNGLHEIAIRNSYNSTIENNIIGNNIMAGYGYGVSINDGSAYTNISKNYFYNSRHCIATGGYNKIGQPRDIIVIGNTFVDSTGTDGCLDAHPITESYYIYNNTIYSPASNWAVESGAKITKVVGNIIYGGYGAQINKPPSGYIFEVNDNKFINSKYLFKYYDLNDVPALISIKNNTITGNILSIAEIYNAKSFIISGNQFDSKNPNVGSHGILIKNSANGIISNNSIQNTYNSGLYLLNTKNTIISNNNVTNYNKHNSNSEYGIKIDNSSYNIISNNVLARWPDAFTYGIKEISGSDYNKINDNDLSNVGTDAIISQRIQLVGNISKELLKNNLGYKTENDILSGTFTIDSTGIKTVEIAHGLAMIPNVQNCYLSVVENTVVDDWGLDLIKVVSIDNTSVTAKIKVSKASSSAGATAKLGLRIGNS